MICPHCSTDFRSTGTPGKRRVYCSPTCRESAVVDGIGRRFWGKVDVTPGCWLWTSCKTTSGYGRFKLRDGTMVRAHRYAWMLCGGEDPGPLFVCHRCDVRHCVNPAHLFLGTTEDNMADMVSKGRSPSGPRKPRGPSPRKLTVDVVRAMRALRSSRMTYAAIGTRFGVTPTAARNAVLGIMRYPVPI